MRTTDDDAVSVANDLNDDVVRALHFDLLHHFQPFVLLRA
jgi:hypothetical protein